MKLATEKQINYINNLHRYDRSIKITPQTTIEEASEIIKHLLDCRAKSDTNFKDSRVGMGYSYSILDWNETQGGW